MKKSQLFILISAIALAITALAISALSYDGNPTRGDSNGDGAINLQDVILLRQYFAQYDYDAGASAVQISDRADMNGDGEINLADLCMLRQYLSSESIDGDIHISESNGTAYVTTKNDLSYTVSGYDSIDDKNIFISDSIDLSFDAPMTESFNRFTLSYRSDKALKIFISYTQNGSAREDYYFLESGEGEFSAVIPDFLSGKQGSRITNLKIENLEGGVAAFALLDLESEVASVPDRNYYIKGNRYTLGIDLGWGGTVNYVSDALCPIDGVTNMINNHDTGRLVQQSYYGTGAIEGVFEWGSFNGSNKWPYNPVQGGGQQNTASRLVDFFVGDGYVYIKVQPMDWGKSDIKYITPSYMENWYIIEDDYIRVDNRFVDFSGWEHPVKGQELPAFYTVSYLDSFVWYDGTEPWTGDELSWRHELKFWGDSQYSGECSFRLKLENTETWSAWVSTEDNYGIGLYSPNTDRYSAGRYKYNGSKNAGDNATNYVAPWKQIKIVAFDSIEYSYLIAAGSVDEIRATFTEYKDVIDNESLNKNSVNARRPHFEGTMDEIDFSISGNEKYACYPNATDVIYDEAEGTTKLTVTAHDPYVSIDYFASDIALSASDYGFVEFEYMIPEDNALGSYTAQLFICADTRMSANETDSVRVGLIKDGKYHVARIKLSEKTFWKGRVNLIRLDYFASAEVGDAIYIRSFKLTDGNVASMEKVDFSVSDGMSLISTQKNTTVSFDYNENATALTITGTDPSITLDYSIMSSAMQAEDYTKLRITYMIPETNSEATYKSHIFLCAGSVLNPSGSAMIQKTGLVVDGQYHTIEVDLSSLSYWTGTINKIRFDYFDSAAVGDVFYITSLELVK